MTRPFSSTALALSSATLILALLLHAPSLAIAAAQQPAPSGPQPTVLSAEGQTELRTIVDSGNFVDLRWPNFSDYRGYVQEFYAYYQLSLPWVRDSRPTPQALSFIARFQSAELKGLNSDDYDGSRWDARLALLAPATPHPKESDEIKFDVAITINAMRYISDLHIGRVNPVKLAFNLDVDQKKLNLPEFLERDVVDASDFETVLNHVEPPFPGYWRTVNALPAYRRLAKQQPPPLPAVTTTVKPGGTYSGVPALADYLRLVGDLPQDAQIPSGSAIYQGPLVDAVKHFQARHGMTPDGQLDAKTIEEMNVPFAKRLRQIELTLERWRWMPASLGPAPIVVNIPEFRLRAYDENFKIGLTMNVVVGKAYNHSTPVFTGTMAYLIFRPFWNVPYSITKAEILPALAKNPGYLDKESLEMVDARQNPIAGPVTPDLIQQIRSGKILIRQKPGPKNSLGLVKFMFPNDYDVYMHDTPATSLFSRSRRDFSHGCIRLERPADLAVWVLRNNPGWDAARVRAAMNGTQDSLRVDLAKPIPVYIIYGTVVVDDTGTVHFFDDIYGHDGALEEALANGYPYPW
ncbi:MAG TPA: L,D-transpeptidase family protein [Candidatus Micrarchaeaceae archaeon]|nr:L,D-transpeptidase family protein [Candidatus Micrarchaeaceae archaeon]